MWHIDLENKYEFLAFKWIAAPLLISFVIVTIWFLFSSGQKCQKLAEENGYAIGTYNPGSYRGLGGKNCTCTGRILPDGSIDEEQSIDINFRPY